MEPSNEPTQHQTPVSETPTPVRPPKKDLTGWVFILPVALLLGLAAQTLNGPTPPVAENNTPVATPEPAVAESTPTPKPTSATRKTAPSTTPGSAKQELSSYTIYVPGEDAMLHKQVVQKPATFSEKSFVFSGVKADPKIRANWYTIRAGRALEILFKESNNLFPKGTPVPTIDVVKEDLVTVNFSKDFPKAHVWQGEKIPQLAIYSIVNTLNSDDLKSGQTMIKVQLLADGKPFDVLGELDAREPFEPNMQLVAQS